MSMTPRVALGPGAVFDAAGRKWTWRGHGYAIDSQPDRDWKGRPWTVSAETIRECFGRGGRYA